MIKVENLGKRYRLRHQTERHRYRTLRDVIAGKVKGLIPNGNGKSGVRNSVEDFWALKEVSFEIKEGEVVGIIGRNGAGKSTLLKILSRITEPTAGRVELNGRVASLLEVGTGFHPELTGRENIFLNGAILGMSRVEIKKKFDEIVAFAEVEKFLDTPVKHYSSGMYVRLAFAVAAHLEPEILIVDEVLAVGDGEFQKKCLGKMQDVSTKEGRTVLFVSHNMETIDRLTSRCIMLKAGTKAHDGETADVVAEYLRTPASEGAELSRFRSSAISGTISILEAWAETLSGERRTAFRQAEPIRIVLRIKPAERLVSDFAIVLENGREQALFTTHLSDLSKAIKVEEEITIAAELLNPMLRRGRYAVSLAAFSPDRTHFYDVLLHVPIFELAGSLDPAFPEDIRWGDLYAPIPWKVNGNGHC
jgi:ABC-type polysaccharide/polyol phosphate transport system ATPase subunit